METPTNQSVRDRDAGAPPIFDDPVLAGLSQAEAAYRDLRAREERQLAELRDAHTQLTSARESYRQVTQDLRAAQTELRLAEESRQATQAQLANALEYERQVTERLQTTEGKVEQGQREAERQRKRAERLTAAVQEFHRALFRGNLYELILKACLNISEATRGLYVTAKGEEKALRIRAAVGIEGYPDNPSSDFLKALCLKVLEDNNTFVGNNEADWASLPAPTSPHERFRNCIAAPVVLLKDLDGILIIADKTTGPFEEEDVETLLSVGDQAAVAVENSHLRQELQGAYLATITALADAVEAKDPYTHGHCQRVARYARLIAERMKLSDHEQSVVYYTALLHDVGKIAVSDGLLNKPGQLLPEERELVRSHARVGYDLIRKIPVLEEVGYGVLHHHEWWDGSGYPDGLAGDAIPIISRIVSVADAFGAMIDRRSYKEAFSEEQARAELQRCAGRQFDARVVEAFLSVLGTDALRKPDDEDEEWSLVPFFASSGDAREEL